MHNVDKLCCRELTALIGVDDFRRAVLGKRLFGDLGCVACVAGRQDRGDFVR